MCIHSEHDLDWYLKACEPGKTAVVLRNGRGTLVAAVVCKINDLQDISNAVRNAFAWHGDEGEHLDLQRCVNVHRAELGLPPVAYVPTALMGLAPVALPPPTGIAPESDDDTGDAVPVRPPSMSGSVGLYRSE